MSTFDRRRVLSTQQELMAAGAGVAAGLGVGVVVFYLARIMLQRQPMPASASPIPGAAADEVPAAPVAAPRGSAAKDEAGRHG